MTLVNDMKVMFKVVGRHPEVCSVVPAFLIIMNLIYEDITLQTTVIKVDSTMQNGLLYPCYDNFIVAGTSIKITN